MVLVGGYYQEFFIYVVKVNGTIIVEIVGQHVVVGFRKESPDNLVAIESLMLVGMDIVSKQWKSTKEGVGYCIWLVQKVL